MNLTGLFVHLVGEARIEKRKMWRATSEPKESGDCMVCFHQGRSFGYLHAARLIRSILIKQLCLSGMDHYRQLQRQIGRATRRELERKKG